MKPIAAWLFRRYSGSGWLLQRKAKTQLILALVTLALLLADLVLTSYFLGHPAPELLPNALLMGGLGLSSWIMLRGHYQAASAMAILVLLIGLTYTRVAITGKFDSAGAYDFIQYVLDLVIIIFYSNLIAQRKRTLVLTFSCSLGFLVLYAWLLARGSHSGLAAPTVSVMVGGFLFLVVAGLINFLTFLQNQKAIQIAQKESDASKENEEKYRSLFEHASEGLFTLSPEGRILEVNEAFARMHGYRLEEWRQVTMDDFDTPESAALYSERMPQLLAGADLTFEVSHRHRDGHVFPLEVSASLVSQRGQPVILNFHRDITGRKQAERDQAEFQVQLAQAQRMDSLGSLAGGVAHDMNNVLAAILAMASARLEAEPAGGPSRQAFATIAQAATRGGQMVKSLLSFARQSPAEERELDLNAILGEEVKLLERTTLAKVRLDLDLGTGLRQIKGDASALTHAFLNLCVNAVDAMPGGGVLSLRTRNLDPHRVEVVVEDTGAGMTREVLEKAMDPFFTTKPVGRGTGLGLSMVYATVKAHRGELELLSQPGRGTSVRLRFPACEPAPPMVPPAEETGSSPVPRPLSVLLVDDDELVQDALELLLTALGHTAHPARSGEAALALLEGGLRPDRIILDLNMPGLGGPGTLPHLRLLCPSARVVLVTGRVDQAALDLAVAYPSVTLLPKPFTIKELKAQLEPLGP